MADKEIFIDFGSTNTRVLYRDSIGTVTPLSLSGIPEVPSAFFRDSNGLPYIGRYPRFPSDICISRVKQRFFFDRVGQSKSELDRNGADLEEYFRLLRQLISQSLLPLDHNDAEISLALPESFITATSTCQDFLARLAVAGFSKVHLFSEQHAAVRFAMSRLASSDLAHVAASKPIGVIVDIGNSTTDIAIIRFERKTSNAYALLQEGSIVTAGEHVTRDILLSVVQQHCNRRRLTAPQQAAISRTYFSEHTHLVQLFDGQKVGISNDILAGKSTIAAGRLQLSFRDESLGERDAAVTLGCSDDWTVEALLDAINHQGFVDPIIDQVDVLLARDGLRKADVGLVVLTGGGSRWSPVLTSFQECFGPSGGLILPDPKSKEAAYLRFEPQRAVVEGLVEIRSTDGALPIASFECRVDVKRNETLVGSFFKSRCHFESTGQSFADELEFERCRRQTGAI